MAGSDSGGGAGIQADLRVMHAFGVHGCTLITALTAQNTLGVLRADPVAPAMLEAQFEALIEDLPPAAFKTGMLCDASTCRTVAGFLDRIPAGARFVCDPVMVAGSGDPLLSDDAIACVKNGIVPRAAILTPNIPEAEVLLGRTVSAESMEEDARALLALGPASVFLKGGHLEGGAVCRDLWTDGAETLWLESPRLESRCTHGTGCVLSSALTALLALGWTPAEAAQRAHGWLAEKLRAARPLGHGNGPVF
ncbi:Hydroxymethylpyrimidine/phosphomethylpyrimidine kinase [Kiritimatiella glycovorans]|uniref:hydroxymethylpyrimidine kinase n=2 Tax=Kiritimatiella glycovorans TaxID=1307763 RepID=A0A0G3EFP1_9BACT|nr:Hydroxymethylpyrimidine/phosphomethylpyrimidine kinase [Kiritimatiella glycovorans]